MIKKCFDKLFSIFNNPAIFTAFVIFVVVIIIYFTIGFAPEAKKAGHEVGKALTAGVKTVHNITKTVEDTTENMSNFALGTQIPNDSRYATNSTALEKKEKQIDAPYSLFSASQAKIIIQFENNPIDISSSNTEQITPIFDKRMLKHTLKEQFNNVKCSRRNEINTIFDRVIKRIPTFAEVHYDERADAETFIRAMNTELLSQDTLDTFILNTAQEIDLSVLDAVKGCISSNWKKLTLKYDARTLEILKKKLPTSREICEAVYTDLINKHLADKNKSEALSYYEHLTVKHPVLSTMSKAAVVLVIAYFSPLISKILTVGIVATDMRTYARINTLKNGLINSFNDKRKRFIISVNKIIDSMLKKYIKKLSSAQIKIINRSLSQY